ncbi:MAG: (Fe-S)-binding protein [Desulfobacterales bacterium]|nr:(Fe-S)-binding protein [Desulfobacterales bacterium]
MNSLSSLKEIAEKCVRCGICQSVCPVFAEIQREAAVARGKVSLIQKILSGDAGYSQKMSTYLLQCLGCGACSENCPNGVRADELILAARALMVEKRGLSLPKWLILRKILNSVYLLPMLLKTGSLLQGLILKRIPKESGLHLRFSLPYLNKDRFIPSLATPFFLDRYPNEVGAEDTKKRIGLFSGCSINYLFPSIGESTLRLLTRNHFSVILPKEQTCCGLPAYGSGDIETAKSLAQKNIKAFAHSDQILVPCASCFYFLKEGYVKLFPGDEEVKSFSQKIVEPSTFFLGLIKPPPQGDRPLGPDKKFRVTFHDPCHLRRGMKIFQEPRRLLQCLPGVEFVEMKRPDRCCGMAGSFNLIYYNLSKKILRHKLDDIEATKADYVVTACLGCMIQLQDGIHQRKMKTKAIHFVDLLDEVWELPRAR